MGFFERRRNPGLADDLDSKIKLTPDDLLKASNSQRQTLIVTIDTKGRPEIYQRIRNNVRGWDVLYKTGEAVTLFALVPDAEAAKAVSKKIANLVGKYEQGDNTKKPQVQPGMQINSETREARFDTEEELSVGELLARLRELKQNYPGVFRHVDIVYARIRTNADYLSCRIGEEGIDVSRGTIFGEKKYRIGARTLDENFIVCPERAGKETRYDAPNKTLNIKAKDVYSGIGKSDIDD